jgi:hypothetical protein
MMFWIKLYTYVAPLHRMLFSEKKYFFWAQKKGALQNFVLQRTSFQIAARRHTPLVGFHQWMLEGND